MSLGLSEYVEVGVEVVRVRALSSSSCSECRDLREPNRLVGLPALCRLFGLVLDNSRSMLAFELTLLSELSEVVGLGASISVVPSLGGVAESGLEEKPKGAVRRFFCNMVGA